MKRLVASIRILWNASGPLTAAGLGMLGVLVFSVAAMAVDPRVISGAPAWLKPAKFAASTAIYALTLAWLFTYLPGRPRLRRIVGWGTALILILEVALIDMQAARGVTSHFNVASPFDATVYSVMGGRLPARGCWRLRSRLRCFARHFRTRASAGPSGWGCC